MSTWLDRIGRLVRGAKAAADATVAREEAALVRGRIAGKPVRDDVGALIIDAGHVIDDDVIERASSCGKLHALTGAVLAAKAQDWNERAAALRLGTDEGREAQSLDTVEQYMEARRYLGRIAVVDVTDVRGEVLIPAGRAVSDDDVRKAREAGLLSALIYSAGLAQPERPPSHNASARNDVPLPGPRRRLPLVPLAEPDGDDPGAEDDVRRQP